MLKQNQTLKLLQKISPQQIQFIKLLQVPTASLEQRIKEEIEQNPALEDEKIGFGESQNDEYKDLDSKNDQDTGTGGDNFYDTHEGLDDYFANDAYDYKTQLPRNIDDDEDEYEAPIVQMKSLYDLLLEQLLHLDLDERKRTIAEQIIGNIDEDGYLRRPLKSIIQDLTFRQNILCKLEEIENILSQIQQLEPAGIAARDLQECMLLQLKRRRPTPETQIAITIVEKFFDELKKKHFSKIRAKIGVNEEKMKSAYEIISKLNPKPGESQSVIKHEYIIPDFILGIENGKMQIRLNSRNAPDLKISRNYVRMFQKYRSLSKSDRTKTIKEALDFVKARIEAAQWFIDAIKQRQFTLLNTMQSIAEKQEDFFISGGDDRKLRPMILKDIADEIQMDISTVSRVANSKYVQTDFGIYPLKFFFTEGIETEDGMVSNREVKSALHEIIDGESKKRPLSDDKIALMLKEKGYNIARRTVAKYREQLDIPVARLRKEV